MKLIVSVHSNLYLGCGQILEVSTGKVSRGEMKILEMVFSSTKSPFFLQASPVSQPCHTCTPQGLSGSKGERGLPGAVQGTLGTGLQGPHYLRLGSPALPPEGDRPPAHQGLALQIVT